MESNDGPVRVPIIVNQLSGPNDLVRQRHQVPDGRRRSHVLEVRSTFRRQTPLPELVQLGTRLRHTRIKLVEFLGVLKIGRDGLIDGPHDGIVPKCRLFCICAEANYITGTGRFRGSGGRDVGGGWKSSGESRKHLEHHRLDGPSQSSSHHEFNARILVSLALLDHGKE